MRNGCKRIVWGFIFIGFNLNIGIIDILNNSLGYYFIISGVAMLEFESQYFKKAIDSGKLLILLSLPNSFYYGSENGIDLNFLQKYYPYNYIYNFLCTTIGIYFIYNLSMGFRDLCIEKGNKDIAESFLKCSRFYAVIMGLTMIMSSFFINFRYTQANTIMVILFIIGIIINIRLMILVSRCKSLEEND